MDKKISTILILKKCVYLKSLNQPKPVVGTPSELGEMGQMARVHTNYKGVKLDEILTLSLQVVTFFFILLIIFALCVQTIL